MVVGDNSWDCGVCWEKLGGTLASDNGGARDLTEIVGAQTSVAYSWLGITSVETDHGA